MNPGKWPFITSLPLPSSVGPEEGCFSEDALLTLRLSPANGSEPGEPPAENTLVRASGDGPPAGQVPSSGLDNNSGTGGSNVWLRRRALHSFLALWLVSHPTLHLSPSAGLG